MRYLVVKAPYQAIFHYQCDRHKNNGICQCAWFPVVLPEVAYHVVPYHPDHGLSAEAYEKMKAMGVILHETEDQETAQTLARKALEESGILDEYKRVVNE